MGDENDNSDDENNCEDSYNYFGYEYLEVGSSVNMYQLGLNDIIAAELTSFVCLLLCYMQCLAI